MNVIAKVRQVKTMIHFVDREINNRVTLYNIYPDFGVARHRFPRLMWNTTVRQFAKKTSLLSERINQLSLSNLVSTIFYMPLIKLFDYIENNGVDGQAKADSKFRIKRKYSVVSVIANFMAVSLLVGMVYLTYKSFKTLEAANFEVSKTTKNTKIVPDNYKFSHTNSFMLYTQSLCNHVIKHTI